MKHDRLVRMVEQAMKHQGASGGYGLLGNAEIVKLLRRQHAAMVRLVKRQPRYLDEGLDLIYGNKLMFGMWN